MSRRTKQGQDEAPKYLVRIPIRSLNSKPVHDFANYLSSNGRSTALRAFNQPVKISDTNIVEMDFSVLINKKDEKNCFFEVEFDAIDNNIDGTQLRIAELVLTQMRIKWQNGKKINLAFTRELLETSIKEIDEFYSENSLGDKINVVFTSASADDNLSLKPINAKENDAPEADEDAPKKHITTRVPKEISLVEATGYAGRGFANSIQFTLAPWQSDDDGLYFSHYNEIGEEKMIRPTQNQQAYINAMRDPDVKVIMLQAPPGAGKTMFGVRIPMELLKVGAIKTFYYERPTETVGGNYNPYLSGGMDEKFGPFSRVLEEEIATQLGHGNLEHGEKIFKQLNHKKKVMRYDQMYQGGDTLRHSILLGDEMQNKTYLELYHMMTRVGEGSKVILIGDFEGQNSLVYGRESGFEEMFNLMSNPDHVREVTKNLKRMGFEGIDPKTVTTLKFGTEDIKRDQHVAYMYEMNKLRLRDALKAAAEKEALKEQKKSEYRPPHPSLRYTQHDAQNPAAGAPTPD